ncbi:MAG TPA: PEP-CTERM sorting domain-containing protein [Chthoniobacteraceae bacterium]|jgi:hypothetical protein|nr:PEP-CTERM sorting domain-containing protein [Chthoniobacteraceae bacterium]
MKSPRLLALGIASLLPASLAAHAGTDTWDGGGINDILTTPQNWLDDTAPPSDLANTDLIFAGVMRLTPTLNAPFSAHSITFDHTAGGFIILGEQLNVGSGGIANSDPQPMSFANLVSFSGVAASSVDASNGGLTFGNAIGLPTGFLTVDGLGATNFQDIVGASTTALGKFGSGTMTWNPAGPVAFDIDVLDGTLTIGGDGTSNLLASTASIDVTGTSVLNINDSLALDGAQITRTANAEINLAAGRTLNVFNGADVDITGSIGINGSTILVTGAGSTFSADALGVSSGTLIVSAGGDISVSTEFSLGTAGTATLTVENGGTFTTGTGLTTVTATGDLNINAGGTMIVRGDMTVLSSLDIAGTVILDANAPAPAEEIADLSSPHASIEAFSLDAGPSGLATGDLAIVPEPSASMLALLGAAFVGLRRRRQGAVVSQPPAENPARASATLPAAGKDLALRAWWGRRLGNRRSLGCHFIPAD